MITIPIPEAAIRQGVQCTGTQCPTAMALSAHFQTTAVVDPYYAHFYYNGHFTRFGLGPRLQKAILEFDMGREFPQGNLVLSEDLFVIELEPTDGN
jgi:hypothetical protein